MTPVQVNIANYVTRKDASKLFKAYNSGQDYNAIRRELVIKVAEGHGMNNMTLNQIDSIANAGLCSIYGSVKPSTGRKVANIFGLAVDVGIALPVAVNLIEVIDNLSHVPGEYFAVSIAAAYGVYRVGKDIIKRWVNDRRNSLENLAYNFEQGVIENLPRQSQ